jgi:hypothetical protein
MRETLNMANENTITNKTARMSNDSITAKVTSRKQSSLVKPDSLWIGVSSWS